MHEVHDQTLMGILGRSPERVLRDLPSLDTTDSGMSGQQVSEYRQIREQTQHSYPLSITLMEGTLTHIAGEYVVFETQWQVDDFDYYAGADEEGKRFYRDVIRGGPHDSYADRIQPFLDPDATFLDPGIETTEWDEPSTRTEPLDVPRVDGESGSEISKSEGPEVWPVTFYSETIADPTVKFYERVPFSNPIRTVDDLETELDAMMENPPHIDAITHRAEGTGRDLVNNGGTVSSPTEDHPDYVYNPPE